MKHIESTRKNSRSNKDRISPDNFFIENCRIERQEPDDLPGQTDGEVQSNLCVEDSARTGGLDVSSSEKRGGEIIISVKYGT